MMPRRSIAALRLLCAAFAVQSLSACFPRGSLPAREVYRLALPPSPRPLSPPPPALRGALAVMRYVTPGIYGERGIVYRVQDTEYGTYPAREWALPLGDMLGLFTESLIRARPLTTEPALFQPPSGAQREYLWQGTVREFEEVDRGRAVFAAVRLDAVLLRADGDSVLWSGSVRREREVAAPTEDANQVVRTLSALAAESIDELVSEADSAVRAGSARRARTATPPGR